MDDHGRPTFLGGTSRAIGVEGEDHMETKPNRKTWKGEKGQSLVEFALVVPMLLLLVFGIAEFGRAWMTQNILTGAAREASRLAVVRAPYGGTSKAISRATEILTSAKIPVGGGTGAIVSIVLDNNSGLPVDDPNSEYGTVTTTITYNLQAVTPISKIITSGWVSGGYGTIPLSSSTSMRREY